MAKTIDELYEAIVPQRDYIVDQEKERIAEAVRKLEKWRIPSAGYGRHSMSYGVWVFCGFIGAYWFGEGHSGKCAKYCFQTWIPAFAGMTSHIISIMYEIRPCHASVGRHPELK